MAGAGTGGSGTTKKTKINICSVNYRYLFNANYLLLCKVYTYNVLVTVKMLDFHVKAKVFKTFLQFFF